MARRVAATISTATCGCFRRTSRSGRSGDVGGEAVGRRDADDAFERALAAGVDGQRPHRGFDGLGGRECFAPEIGELPSAGDPRQYPPADRLLERGDAARDGGVVEAEFLPGDGVAAGATDRQQHQKVIGARPAARGQRHICIFADSSCSFGHCNEGYLHEYSQSSVWGITIEERAMTIHNEPPPAGSDSDSVPTGLKRVVVASMAGTVVEWYEFFLYGTAATLVFNKVFFPASDSALRRHFRRVGDLCASGSWRGPLGGVVFGHFGDKYGRKKLLQFAILLVGAVDVPDGMPADIRPDRNLGAGVAGPPAVHAGLRSRRRMGWRRAAGRRTQPEPQPCLLGQLAAGRCARRQHARDDRAAGC